MFIIKHLKLILEHSNLQQHEDEFRFITVGIGIYSTQLQIFSVDVVSEIILGHAMSDNNVQEILNIINSQYPKELAVYKAKRNEEGKPIKELVR